MISENEFLVCFKQATTLCFQNKAFDTKHIISTTNDLINALTELKKEHTIKESTIEERLNDLEDKVTEVLEHEK